MSGKLSLTRHEGDSESGLVGCSRQWPPFIAHITFTQSTHCFSPCTSGSNTGTDRVQKVQEYISNKSPKSEHQIFHFLNLGRQMLSTKPNAKSQRQRLNFGRSSGMYNTFCVLYLKKIINNNKNLVVIKTVHFIKVHNDFDNENMLYIKILTNQWKS